ncbi:MAG: NUDIX hydrolase [Armatimonadetes bacterium]|nr:NUDIX hydrolase [Armatimonadota bacterium]
MTRPMPSAWWDDCAVSFAPGRSPAYNPPPAAVVVFAWRQGRFVLGRVPRGWCTPSGRLEPGETDLAAAYRETYEEVGATLAAVERLGVYELGSADGVSEVPAFVGIVAKLGAIPDGSESSGATEVAPRDVCGLYWRWDPLMAAMFRLAVEASNALERRVRGG